MKQSAPGTREGGREGGGVKVGKGRERYMEEEKKISRDLMNLLLVI